MSHPKVTIGVILYKNEKYIKYCLPSLVNQDYPNLEILLRDQSPEGEASIYIHKHMPEVLDKVTLEKGENLWHSGGHNALINKMDGEYYFCCSNDMLYPNNFVSKMVHELEKPENQHYGSATCKLMQWNFENNVKTDVIDSCGLGITRGHQFYDIGQGKKDQGQYDSQKNIFGPSGALGVYRKSALKEVGGFDELLHYKNDIDLAYRLQWAGYSSTLIPSVKVWHDRQVSKNRKRSTRSIEERENSFFGHQVVLKKNYSTNFSYNVRVQTKLNNLLRLMYIVYLEPKLLRQLKKVKKHKNEIEEKKSKIIHKIQASDIENLMS